MTEAKKVIKLAYATAAAKLVAIRREVAGATGGMGGGLAGRGSIWRVPSRGFLPASEIMRVGIVV